MEKKAISIRVDVKTLEAWQATMKGVATVLGTVCVPVGNPGEAQKLQSAMGMLITDAKKVGVMIGAAKSNTAPDKPKEGE